MGDEGTTRDNAISSPATREMMRDTLQMGSDIFDYLTAHPDEEFQERKRLLIQHLKDMELDDDDDYEASSSTR